MLHDMQHKAMNACAGEGRPYSDLLDRTTHNMPPVETARLKAGRHDRGWPKGTARDFVPVLDNVEPTLVDILRAAIKRDPRADGFNYGAALGAPKADPNDTTVPWERRDMAAEYSHIVRMAQSFGTIAVKLSDAAWKLEMATREVRNATTHSEQLTAMEHARKAWNEVNALDMVEGDGIKFYRYGRSNAVKCS